MTGLAISHAPRALGKSGLSVSPLAWGMWRFRGDDVRAAQAKVEAALAAGITLFDTADVYGPDNGEPFGAAEALLGRVLAAAPQLRDRFVLASKGGIRIGTPYDSSAGYLVDACEASLRRLGVERIDLYQIHRPDLLTHPAEIAGAFRSLREAGKVRAFGLSNATPSQTAALMAYLDEPLATVQPEFSALALGPLEDGALDQAMVHDLAVLAWSPLGGGRLGDGRSAGAADARTGAVIAALDALARREGVPRSAVAYAWIMAHPARPIPIVGSQTPERIAEAARAFDVHLDRADWYSVLTASRGVPLP